MKHFTREAIIYGLLNDLFSLNNKGELYTDFSLDKTNEFLRKLDGDARDCVLRSRFLGRWFGYNGSTQKIMFLWGVRP